MRISDWSSDVCSSDLADLAAGRWEGAGLELRLTGWEAPGDLWLLLARGEIGAVTRKAGAFSAELVGAMAALKASVAPSPSPDCRAVQIGRASCRDRVGLYVYISGVASSLKKKHNTVVN